MSATLGEDYAGGIPVLFATYDNGATWAQTDGLELAMTTDVVRERTETYNVVAETRRGNPDNVVMVGAHLDSVFEGPGINDNGSGSATLLEMAVLMGKAHPLNKVRFAWWGAEESGWSVRLLRQSALRGRARADQGLFERRHGGFAELRELHL